MQASTLVSIPPQLPEYLKNIHDLKPIVGVPDDEEVIAIHTVIRAASIVFQVPGIYDPTLSLNLAQHLFEVQMGGCSAFVLPQLFQLVFFAIVARPIKHIGNISFQDAVYTPPLLPSHITVKLEPVAGTPSDEEIIRVHNVVHSYEQLSSFPSMFDPRTHMQLAQHMFDLQLARYVQGATQPRPVMALAQTPAREGEHSEPRPPPSPRQHANSVEPHHVATLGVPDTINPGTGAGPGPAEPIVARDVFGVTSPSATGNLVDSGNAGFQVVMPQLARLGDALENMNRVLVGTQNSMARVECSIAMGFGDQSSDIRSFPHHICALINEKGELPLTNQLPFLDSASVNWTNDQIAQYLRFYNLGNDILEGGETPRPMIKPDNVIDAKDLLTRHSGRFR
ncbi:Laminin domain containing protein [Ceratobasidium theobromae]|uniref:Laminin domain containing protein n=1 Tax=Ceratobasidium theobromae TaxID=1582974 RepID=A0A5N5QAP8_9AGAM|nr:Laminin domain containing protein [Ceratobasidium theobromae]